MQPGRQAVGLVERPRLARQDEERLLKGVLGVLAVRQHALADAEHHRPVPAHQRGEGVLIPLIAKAFQQLAVAGRPDRLGAGESVQMTHQDMNGRFGHASVPPERAT